jgi:hypothetical protein
MMGLYVFALKIFMFAFTPLYQVRLGVFSCSISAFWAALILRHVRITSPSSMGISRICRTALSGLQLPPLIRRTPQIVSNLQD